MDSLNVGDTVFILLPDFSVCKSTIKEAFEDDLFEVLTDDGRHVFRKPETMFFNEKSARAKKFIFKYKFRLKINETIDACELEEKEIIDYALDNWPEEFI